MEKVMLICGGKHQLPIIKKIKELGYYSLCTNLYENSPCFQFADTTGVMDVLDKDSNFLFAKNNRVDAVITDQSEISVKTVAYVSEKMNLPTISYETACLFTDKYKMREFCQKNGFDYPTYTVCQNKDDAIQFYKKHSQKLIIKPVDSFSSKGVFSVESEEEIIQHFDDALLNSEQKKVIIEEYIPGTEFTIDALVSNRKVYNLAISEKGHYSYNENIANSLTFSYYNDNYDYDLLRKTNYDIISSTGITFGLTHCEYKYYNNKFYLIEMAARGGGVYIGSKIVPYISGVDNYKVYIESALGHNTDAYCDSIPDRLLKNNGRMAKLAFLDIPPNNKRVKKIHGVDKIFHNPNVMSFECDIIEGEVIPVAVSDSTRIGHYIITGNSMEELKKTESFIKDSLIIDYYD